MRLNKVAMAGFKSFADRTTLEVGQEIVALVGPNGCGKSNIVDALLWVMGESRASQLRQETNADIIFNGARGRRPSDWCSVELLLDNDGSRDIGMWGKYAQLSVRRQVERDGESKYFVNGQRVRRKDVVDIFAGTGTGARSYGIVEQERVMQVVRSDPKRIRAHLEEAAGVSSYKARRRETESRLEVTRANLSRIEDMMAELKRQLEALERQAKQTERVRRLRRRLATARRLQLMMSVEELEQAHEQADARSKGFAKNLEDAKQKVAEAEQELAKAQKSAKAHDEASGKVVGSHYRAQADLEKARQGKLNFEASEASDAKLLAESEDMAVGQEAKLVEVKAASEALGKELAANETRLAKLAEEDADAQSRLEKAQQALATAEGEVAKARQKVDKAAGEEAEAASRHRVAEYRLKDLRATLERAKSDMELLAPPQEPDREGLSRLREELDKASEAASQNGRRLQELREDMSDTKEEIVRLQGVKGGLNAELELMRRIAENKSEGHVRWLGDRGEDKPRRVIDMVDFNAPGLEMALDVALEACIDGYGVSDLGRLLADGVPPPGMVLASLHGEDANVPRPVDKPGLVPLLDKVEVGGEWAPAARRWLAGVYLAPDNMAALRSMDGLSPGEMIVTSGGVCFHDDMARAASDRVAGFAWKKRLAKVERSLAKVAGDIAAKERELAEQRDNHAKLAKDAEGLVAKRHACEQGHSQLEQETRRREQALAYHQEQVKKLKADVSQATKALQDREREAKGAAADVKCAAEVRGRLERELAEARLGSSEASALVADITKRQGAAQSELSRLGTAREHLQARLGENQARHADLNVSLAKSRTQIVEITARMRKRDPKGIDVELKKAEASLAGASAELKKMEDRQRELAQAQAEAEKGLARLRGELDEIRESRQELELEAAKRKVKVDGMRRQLEALGADDGSAGELRKEVGEKEAVDELVAKLGERIDRAGPVNDVAEAEHAACEGRLAEVREQHEDLAAAIASLQDAIGKIDAEMLERLKSVHEKLNLGFASLFKKLFDGGEASVELVGDNLLEAGLQIRATPPGKRVSSIQALSGGEKTLTAIAFLFALNELTPPVFCVLDEVDAALDEANTLRYCRLIESMVGKTQFLIITHNKIVIARAGKLVGVTQEEKGVSRLVSVRLDEALDQARAVEMAAQS